MDSAAPLLSFFSLSSQPIFILSAELICDLGEATQDSLTWDDTTDSIESDGGMSGAESSDIMDGGGNTRGLAKDVNNHEEEGSHVESAKDTYSQLFPIDPMDQVRARASSPHFDEFVDQNTPPSTVSSGQPMSGKGAHTANTKTERVVGSKRARNEARTERDHERLRVTTARTTSLKRLLLPVWSNSRWKELTRSSGSESTEGEEVSIISLLSRTIDLQVCDLLNALTW